MSDRGSLSDRRSRLSQSQLAELEARLQGSPRPGYEWPGGSTAQAVTSADLARADASTSGPGARSARWEPFPLTDVQGAYWVGRQLDADLGQVGSHGYSEYESRDLDVGRLEAAFQILIDRHDALRLIVTADGRQRVLRDTPPFRIPVTDLRGSDSDRVEAQLAATRREMSHQVLRPDVWPLFELRAHLVPEGTVRLHVSIDGLLADGHSMRILARELRQLYEGNATLGEPFAYTFREYVLAQREREGSAEFVRARRYWQSRLDEIPAGPDLPITQALSTVRQPRFQRLSATLSTDDWALFRRHCSSERLTPSAAILAAYSYVLALWSRTETFTLVATLFDRQPCHPDVASLVGDFTSTLPVVISASGGSFREHAQHVQAQFWSDLDNALYPGVRVGRDLAIAHPEWGSAVFPVVFTSTLTDPDRDETDGEHGFLGKLVYSVSQTPQVILDHQISEAGGRLVIVWDHVDEVFPVGMIDAMFATYVSLLTRLARGLEAWDSAAKALLPAEMQRGRSSDVERAQPFRDGLLHDGFERQTRANPSALAVISPGVALTYGDLSGLAAGNARWLEESGAGPNRLVAIVMDGGWEQVVAVLAVLRSGAAYLPIDAELPLGRVLQLLDDGEVEIVLTQARHANDVPWPPGVRVRVVDAAADAVDETGSQRPSAMRPASPSDLAYVIYTSGSTGSPKGVMINHRGALNTIEDINRRFAVDRADRVLGLSSLSFDLSVWDIFGTLAAGGTLVLPSVSGRRDPAHWATLCRETGITIWNSVPALMSAMLDYADIHPDHAGTKLRLAMLSGDWIPVSMPDRIRSRYPATSVVSLGGATEASIWSILYPIGDVDPGWTSIPYGRSMSNQSVVVLNGSLVEVPDWVAGELYIGGVGVAEGYWRDTEKTAAKFVRHPVTGERLYRTGDLGRYLPDGNIEFLGRQDSQVKLNGYRVDLGEVESVLARHPLVQHVVVGVLDIDGSRRLNAYVVRRDGVGGTDDLRTYLEARLPQYMIPAGIAVLQSLPVTRNGKIDRSNLPSIEMLMPPEREREQTEAADRDLADRLRDLIAGIVPFQNLTIDANLYQLGANSLDLIRIANVVEVKLGVRPRLGDFLRDPTIATLVHQLSSDDEYGEVGDI